MKYQTELVVAGSMLILLPCTSFQLNSIMSTKSDCSNNNNLINSKFLGNTIFHHHQNNDKKRTSLMYMYDSTFDPPNNKKNEDNSNNASNNIWSALASTERWIDATLNTLGNAAPNKKPENNNKKSNPYSRKEVGYVCETSENMEEIVAGIFRRLKEERETGDEHGLKEMKIAAEMGPHRYKEQTLRETLVIVIPSCNEIRNNFQTFHELIQRINTARRNARDIQSSSNYSEEEEEWTTSVNMSHLHPQFGEKTPQQILADEVNEEGGEVDLNLEAYREKRLLARRSPHPTIVIEVRSSPPIDFSLSDDDGNITPKRREATSPQKKDASSNELMKLEALFGKGASFDHPEDTSIPINQPVDDDADDDFYAKIGAVSGIQEMTSPTHEAQLWVASHLQSFDALRSSFHIATSSEVDAAYEFVFGHLASARLEQHQKETFLVMEEFCPASATSFDKFKKDVGFIIDSIPSLVNEVTLDVYHPEHIEKEKRSPMPIFVFHWMR